ncbi:MAG TPA: cupredoxin domain-containing protein [Sphingobacteriaceae bacterium]|nr:cupredoxin domain-containing protein [Sphingobacteriaceae bacterium]
MNPLRDVNGRRPMAALAVVLGLCLILLTGCPRSARRGPVTSGGMATEHRVVMGDNFFQPNRIEVPLGTEITVHLPNQGALVHNFQLDEFDINEDVEPGDEKTIYFTADEAGTFTFICNIPGHKESGMVGTLEVKEP